MSGLQHELVRAVAPKGVTLTNSGDDPSNCLAPLTFDSQGMYQTTYAYDAQHNPTSVSRTYVYPGLGTVGATTTIEYSSTQPGQVTFVTPPRGNTGSTPDHSYATAFAYYGSGTRNGLLERVEDAVGNKTTFDYDAVGRRTSVVDPLGNVSGGTPANHRWEYTYDKEDRLLTASTPVPRPGVPGEDTRLVTESRYDAVGNLLFLIDAKGQVTKYLYDERDSLAEVHESPDPWLVPASPPTTVHITGYQYDALGNLTQVTRAQGDAAQRMVRYTYDGLNRVRTETQYSGMGTSGPLAMTTAYDANSNRASVTDQLNRTTNYTYDRLNRLTKIDYAAGTPDVDFSYDRNGNRLTMQTGSDQTTYAYDEVDRLLSVMTPGTPSRTVGYRYNRNGERIQVIYPGGEAVTSTYDNAGRLTGLPDWASRPTAYSYFADGALATQTNPNGTTTTYA